MRRKIGRVNTWGMKPMSKTTDEYFLKLAGEKADKITKEIVDLIASRDKYKAEARKWKIFAGGILIGFIIGNLIINLIITMYLL